jgi:nitrate reductase gamma subunit
MKIFNIIFYLILGYIAIILASLSSIWKWFKDGLVQTLPPDEDNEFSEKWRR